MLLLGIECASLERAVPTSLNFLTSRHSRQMQKMWKWHKWIKWRWIDNGRSTRWVIVSQLSNRLSCCVITLNGVNESSESKMSLNRREMIMDELWDETTLPDQFQRYPSRTMWDETTLPEQFQRYPSRTMWDETTLLDQFQWYPSWTMWGEKTLPDQFQRYPSRTLHCRSFLSPIWVAFTMANVRRNDV